MVSVYDSKAESWSFPAQADNKASAIRMFGDLVRDGRTLVGQHPEDFGLWIVGEFDTETGTILTQMSHLANGNDFAKVPADEVRN